MMVDQALSSISTMWEVTSRCPATWETLLQACDAGFFHSPAGLLAGAPSGEPLFCMHHGPTGIDAVALGVQHACRLSRRSRHVYFPCLPAIEDPGAGSAIVEDLLTILRDRGAAEVVMDSFDAGWDFIVPQSATALPREEFVIDLTGSADDLLERCTAHHRRHLRKGERSAWKVRAHVGGEASGVLDAVQDSARTRAEGRGHPIPIPPVSSFANERLDGGSPWGATVFGAWNDEQILAAMLVGWAGRRAYYVAGGATPAGYTAGAASWLHWRIAILLRDAEYVTYNLGGASTDETGAGLRRFKLGFGPEVVRCIGARWVLRPSHVLGHVALRGLTLGRPR